ncbi:hypothetical protein BDB01DRAFT_836976 [Pilobolus umbonatus]|nr:hypothetical protein BDB01DRAFT_836976 [Pilobolus umbonatus]
MYIYYILMGRYPPNFTDQTKYRSIFKKVLLFHRLSSVIWCGTLCFQFITLYNSMLRPTYRLHRLMGWIMTGSVFLNVFSGLSLMYIKTKQDTNTQNYGLLTAAVYSFVAQIMLIITAVIQPKKKNHRHAAIRLITAPLSALLQHLIYFAFVYYQFDIYTSKFFWDISVMSSGFMGVLPVELYLWKKRLGGTHSHIVHKSK